MRRIVAVLILGCGIAGAMYGYDYATTASLFTIQTVDYAGLTRVDNDSIARLLGDLKGSNLFLAPLETYEARIADDPRVARVQLHRVVPDRVMVEVTEREPVALIYTDRFHEVDAYGMVMSADTYTAMLDLPIITGLARGEVTPGEISDSPRLRRALDALTECRGLGADFAAGVSELRVDENGVSIRASDRDRVLVLGDGDYHRRLRKYMMLKDTIAARDRDAQLIDLRFEDQVVLRGQN